MSQTHKISIQVTNNMEFHPENYETVHKFIREIIFSFMICSGVILTGFEITEDDFNDTLLFTNTWYSFTVETFSDKEVKTFNEAKFYERMPEISEIEVQIGV